MTLDEAFALVRTNDLRWHGLHQNRDNDEWYVRLSTLNTHSGMISYGFGQHLDLTEAIRQAILAAKEWEAWRPSEALPAPAFGRKPSSRVAQAALDLGLTDAEVQEVLRLKGVHDDRGK